MKPGEEWRGIAGVVCALVLVSCGENGKGGSADDSEDPAEEVSHVLARENSLPPAGTVGEAVKKVEMVDAPMVIVAGETRSVGTMNQRTEQRIRFEVVSPDEVRVVVGKDAKEEWRTLDGNEERGTPVTSLLEGKELTFRLGDSGWVGTLDSGEELAEEGKEKIAGIAEELERKTDVEMYGTEARQVGSEWEVDPNQIPGFGGSADFGGSYRVRFDRVETFDGLECAVLIGKMEVRGRIGSGAVLGMTGTTVVYRSLDYLEDLKVEMSGELSLSGSPQPGTSMTVRGPFRMEERTRLTLP